MSLHRLGVTLVQFLSLSSIVSLFVFFLLPPYTKRGQGQRALPSEKLIPAFAFQDMVIYIDWHSHLHIFAYICIDLHSLGIGWVLPFQLDLCVSVFSVYYSFLHSHHLLWT